MRSMTLWTKAKGLTTCPDKFLSIATSMHLAPPIGGARNNFCYKTELIVLFLFFARKIKDTVIKLKFVFMTIIILLSGI